MARMGVPLITCTPAGPTSSALPWTCVVLPPARGRPVTAPYYLRCRAHAPVPRRTCGMSRARPLLLRLRQWDAGHGAVRSPGGIGNIRAADVADPRGNGSVT